MNLSLKSLKNSNSVKKMPNVQNVRSLFRSPNIVFVLPKQSIIWNVNGRFFCLLSANNLPFDAHAQQPKKKPFTAWVKWILQPEKLSRRIFYWIWNVCVRMLVYVTRLKTVGLWNAPFAIRYGIFVVIVSLPLTLTWIIQLTFQKE